MRWMINFYDFRFKWTATAAIGIHPTKASLSKLENFKNTIWTWGHFRRTICNKILFSTWKNATKTYGMLQTAFRPSCMNRVSVFEWHKRFKEGRESVRGDERCVTDYLTKIGIKTVAHPPYSPYLTPCDFWSFPKLRGCHYGTNWIEERGCDEGHWHTHTRWLPWHHPNIVGKVQQVHCSRRRLLRRGLEGYVCIINKSAHTKKVCKLI